MNEEIPRNTSDKIYRIAVVALLVILVGLQAFTAFQKPPVNETCQETIDSAIALNAEVASAIILLDSSYDTNVYERADNINQQILLSQEHTFMAVTYTAQLNEMMLMMATACQ